MARLEQHQLKQRLAQQLSPLYVLVGDEPLAQSECLDAIRQAARKEGADERTSYIVERNFNWQLLQQYAAIPLTFLFFANPGDLYS